MNNHSLSPNSLSHENIVVPSRDMTWKDVLLSVLAGYVRVVLFFIIVRYSPLDFFFRSPSEGFPFSELWYFRFTRLFLTVYTVYAVNKIIWFSLRKNRCSSAIYGSIRRFFDSYVWCFSISFVPFCFFDSVFFSNIMGTAYNPERFSFWSRQEVARVGYAFYMLSIVLSSFLVALIFAQRLIIACYPTITKKSIGKTEDNARFWQSREPSPPITFYVIVRYFALAIWEFCYWIAMFVLFVTSWFLVSYTWFFLYTKRLPDVFDVMGVWWPVIFGNLFHITVCYLAFSIVMRRLFGLFRQYVRQYVCPKGVRSPETIDSESQTDPK